MSYIGIDYGSKVAYIAEIGQKVGYGEVGHKRSTKLEYTEATARDFIRLFRQAIAGADAVYIEQAQHLSMALEMAMMASRLQILVLDMGLPTRYVHPATWRKLVLGNGRANKQDAVDWAQKTYGFIPHSLKVRSYEPDHNACEAIAIAHYCYLKENPIARSIQGNPSTSGAQLARPSDGISSTV